MCASDLNILFMKLLEQVMLNVKFGKYQLAQATIECFVIKYHSQLFFFNPIIHFELLSLKGYLCCQLDLKEQALKCFNQVLKFNPFHLQTLQRKIEITKDDEKKETGKLINLLRVNTSNYQSKVYLESDHQSTHSNNDSVEEASIAKIAAMNPAFSQLKSIERITESHQKRKSVTFKNTADYQKSGRRDQNYQMQTSLQEEDRHSERQKRTSILKKSKSHDSDLIDFLDEQFTKYIEKRNVNQKSMEEKKENGKMENENTPLSENQNQFNILKIKNIQGKRISRSSFAEENQKMIAFQYQILKDQIHQGQQNSQNNVMPLKKEQILKKKSFTMKRKSSLAEQSKFAKFLSNSSFGESK